MCFPIRARAFVANIHDCVNYDIEISDIEISDIEIGGRKVMRNIIDSVESSLYQYVSISEEDFRTGIVDIESRTVKSRAFKCRLHGIGMRQKKKKPLDLHEICCDIINTVNGHVYITIYGVDNYCRLLVDIETPVVSSLREHLMYSKSVFRYR